MEIAKMMMGGKSEGKYAYYAFQPVPSIPSSSQASDRSQSASVLFSTYEGNPLTLYYSDAIKPSTSGTGFVPVNPSTFTILAQAGQAAPTQLVGKYVYKSLIPDMGYDYLRTFLIVSVDSIGSYYNGESILYYLKCYYKQIDVSIGATKYGVTDQSDAYATRTLKADGFVYAKITGQTTV